MLIGICKYCKNYKPIKYGYGHCKCNKFIDDICGSDLAAFDKDTLIYSNEFGVATDFCVRDHFGCIHYDEVM